MTAPLSSRVRFFNPREDFSVSERRLPHWSQAGAIVFITWRTWDSIPKQVLQGWLAERDAWLQTHGISANCSHLAPRDAVGGHLTPRDASSRGARGLHWRDALHALGPALVQEFHRRFSERWNDHLDACHGACALRRPELSQIVADSLLHFDQERYDLTDFVVMPNHFHVLAAFPDEHSMLAQCDSWKHFTAAEVNRALGRRGRVWQQDGFDHLVRSLSQFEYLRSYIANNPQRANLRPSEFRHLSKPT